MPIRAVLFDFDGTLTQPGSLDFPAIREAIGCPAKRPILEHIGALAPELQDVAHRILNRFETQAARQSQPNFSAEEVILFLLARDIKLGIISRNSRASIVTAFANFNLIQPGNFSVIVSRDDPFPPKPSPEGIRAAAERMHVRIDEMLVVGDYVYDIEAGHAAGAGTVLITNGQDLPCEPRPDFTIARLDELMRIVTMRSPLAPGKLPNPLLQCFLSELGIGSASLLLGPGVGEDVAAVPLEGHEVLVLKSDPVTFATDRIGHYAVVVNANDVATSGAIPRWLLTTLLFPPGTTPLQVRAILQDLNEVARHHGLVLCGGHTEITDAVTRPVVVGQVAGTVAKNRLIDKKNMAAGDRIIMTKGVAVEGTCLIAREFGSRLIQLGIAEEEIETARNFLTHPGISVLAEATVAANCEGVTAMHDVTEGGLATALEELAAAGGHGIRVHVGDIPLLEQTKDFCRVLGLDPMGLIGSGSLLIVCRREQSDRILASLRTAGLTATLIGEVSHEPAGIEAVDRHGRTSAWKSFEVDELARLFRNRTME